MMSKYFTSVVKLVERSGEAGASDDAAGEVLVRADQGEGGSKLTFRCSQPHPPPQHRPPSSSSSRDQVTLTFDRIFPQDLSSSDLYKETVKEVVEGVLLGYHGTVITLSPSHSQGQRSEALWGKGEGLILRATRQMCRCLRRSRKSKSKSSTSSLVILCSLVAIVEEEVRDLLYDASTGVGERVTEATDLPPKLELVNGRLQGASQCPLGSSSEAAKMFEHARETKERLLKSYPDSSRIHHHTVLTLTVEFGHFGSMTAPVSGNLVFVELSASDPLIQRQSHTRGEVVDKKVRSLFAFADVVRSLTVGGNQTTSDLDTELNPHVPTASSETPDLHESSMLTQLIGESLGGNCKTLLMTFVDPRTPSAASSELLETLKLASRARTLQNAPNKRDLAEKALMSAYLRGLEEVYGTGVRAQEDKPKPEPRPKEREEKGGVLGRWGGGDVAGGGGAGGVGGGSQASLLSEDIDNAYDEMIDATKGEER